MEELESMLIFFSWLEEEIQNTTNIVKISYKLSDSSIKNLNKIKLFALENLILNKEKAISLFKQEDFKLFNLMEPFILEWWNDR